MREDLTEKKITNQEVENSLKSIFFGVDSLESKKRVRRVLVCVLLDKNGKLNVKNCSIQEYEKPKISQFSKLSYFVEDIIASHLLIIAKEKLRELSVGSNDNDNDKILNDLSNLLIEELETELNYSVLEFSRYFDMKNTYDEITFEKKSNIRKRIESYPSEAKSKLEASIDKLAREYKIKFSKEDGLRLGESITGISEIRDDVVKSNNITNLSLKEASALSKKEEFDKELEELTKGYFLKSIEHRAEGLLVNCESILSNDSLIQVDETIKINTRISKLIDETIKINISKLKIKLNQFRNLTNNPQTDSFSIKDIDILNKKFEECDKEFINLTEDIKNLVSPAKENSPIVLDDKKLDEFKQKIYEIILELKDHTTSEEKKSIKEEIESKLDDIVNKKSSEDLIQAIEEIKIYILNERPKIDEYRGGKISAMFFNGRSILKEIVDKLDTILDKFIANNDIQSQSIDHASSNLI
jgi:hypothetical protein